MSTYILSVVFAAVMLLLAAVISAAIQYEGGANPKDPGKRKMWFWTFAVLNPAVFYAMAAFVMLPENRRAQEDWMAALPAALGVGVLVYVGLGFVLSKMFKNGKLGNWF